ncbi:MAG TPA: alpha/beta family hydrolase [Microbacterium sp.]|uniref:alpha/beta hydrolase family protein n=1 Tax=Microbacterium sp. TaxID=51671 RepID=UPI002B916F79|nr:alpha/beta family hydrolase [Microbacterium sp.]HWI31709.1 alpha/beta family hydrolase [Microbacterium sp.]
MSEAEVRLPVDLPGGTVEVSAAYGRPDEAWATIAIAHGAGAGYGHPFMTGFARGMRAQGAATLRFNFAYIEAGRRMPGPATHAIAAWRAAFAFAVARSEGEPVWVSGKSYGGRMGSMAVAEGLEAHGREAAGLVYLGYPLHPPGDPQKARVAHLPGIRVPQLFVSGANDPFVAPHEQLEAAVAACQDASIAWIADAGHSFDIKGRKRPADAVGAALAPLVAEFLRR